MTQYLERWRKKHSRPLYQIVGIDSLTGQTRRSASASIGDIRTALEA
jgi:hypothetical protein